MTLFPQPATPSAPPASQPRPNGAPGVDAAPNTAAPWVASAERILGLTLTALFVFLIATFFACAGGMWRDEANSVALVSLPSVAQITHHLDGDSFPLGWFLLLRAWTCFARTDLAIRALGLLTALAIPAVLLRSARASRIGFPFWSFLLLGLNPVVIRCIGATRAYGLGVLLVLLTGHLLWQACCRLTWRTGLAAFAAALVCVHCLYYNVVFVGALCLGAVLVCWRNGARGRALFFAGTWLAGCLSLLPYLPVVKRQQAWSALIAHPGGTADLGRMLAGALGANGGWMVLVWMMLAVLGIGAGVRCQQGRALSPDAARKADRALYALAAMGTGLAGYGVFLLVLRYPTNTWYYVLPLSLTAWCLDLLLGGVTRPAFRAARALLCFALLAGTFSPARLGAQARQTGMDLAAAAVAAQARPGDLVLVSPWYDGASFRRCYHGAAPWQTVPPMACAGYGGMDQMKRQMMARQPLTPVFGQITQTLRSGGRVWLVETLPWVAAGAPVSALLPAPQCRSGWSMAPYVRNWGQQVQAFLQAHATQIHKEPAPAPPPINSLEDPQIETCHGWH